MSQTTIEALRDAAIALRDNHAFRGEDSSSVIVDAEEFSALTAALSALHAKVGAGVKVKELEWWSYSNGDAEVTTTFGEVYTAYPDGCWRKGQQGTFIKAGHDINAAKAAVQSHYETSIRSTITLQSEPVGYVAKCDLASLTDPEQGLCVNIWRHEQSDGDVPLYTSPALAHQPVIAGWDAALEDARLFGAGYVMIKPTGLSEHIPIDGIRLSEAAHRPVTAGLERQKEITLLSIIRDMGGQTDADDSRHSWLNWFCNDEVHGQHSDTFNRCIENGWLRSTHDSDTDHSMAYLTNAGRAALKSEGGNDE